MSMLKNKSNEDDGHEVVAELLDSALFEFSTIPLLESLTTLATDRLRREAYQISKAIMLFSNTLVEHNGIKYHVCLAQALIKTCLPFKCLQNELLL